MTAFRLEVEDILSNEGKLHFREPVAKKTLERFQKLPGVAFATEGRYEITFRKASLYSWDEITLTLHEAHKNGELGT
jgi:hypothetical protein